MDDVSSNGAGLDLEFGDATVDPLESGYLDTEVQALSSGLQRGDLDPQALYRRKGYGTTFGIEVTPKKSLKALLFASGGGAVAGFLVAGPVGALAGLVVGGLAEEAYSRFMPHPVATIAPPSPAPAPIVVPAAAAPTATPAPAASA
jgi:hypothetical protein